MFYFFLSYLSNLIKIFILKLTYTKYVHLILLIFVIFISKYTLQAKNIPSYISNIDHINNITKIIDPILYKKKFLIIKSKLKNALDRAKNQGLRNTLLASKSKANKIYCIQLKNLQTICSTVIFSKLKSKVGKYIKLKNIKNDLRIINNLNIFSDIKILKHVNRNNSITLIYKLNEKPKINTIKIKGNNNISTNNLEKIISLKSLQIIDEFQIFKNIKKIKEEYIKNGFYLANITYKIIPIKKLSNLIFQGMKHVASVKYKHKKYINKNFVDIIFYIHENNKIKIKSIYLIGNKKLSSNLIKTIIKTKENHFLSCITKYGTYNEDVLEHDLYLIEKLYWQYGYLDILINKPIINISNNKKIISIIILLHEGNSYKIGNVKINQTRKKQSNYDTKLINLINNNILTLKSLIKKNYIFNSIQLSLYIKQISNYYKNKGYANIIIDTKIIFSENDNIVNLTIIINFGKKIYIERIEITGNHTTSDKIIRQKIKIYEGEIYSELMIRLSKQNIMKTGFFQSIFIDKIPGNNSNCIILIFRINERSSGEFRINLNYSGYDDGIIIHGTIARNNLFGNGQTLKSTTSWSTNKRSLDLAFIDQYLLNIYDEPLTFSCSIHNIKKFLKLFTKMDTGIDITLGYILGKTLSYYTKQWIKTSNIHNTIYIPNFENLKFLLTYTIDRIKIIDKKLQSRLWSLHSNEPSYSTIIKPIIKFDQRNNQIYPSKGYIFELQSEFASPIFGSKLFANYENRYLHNLYNTIDRNFLKSTIFTNHFFRINATIKFYFNIHPLMIKLNIKAGYLNTFGNDLIFENYFIGGYNSIRGYSWKSIGEMHKITSVDNKIISKFTIGGNKKFIINLELEFPIIKNLKITGVIFLDLGNIYDKLHHFFFLGSNICSNKNIKDPLKIYQILGLYASSGIGIRWQTPIGVLRFECATPMTPRIENIITGSNADECFLFHVNLGHYF